MWEVVRWEVMRYLRNKQFIIGLLLTPVLMVAFIALPAAIQRLDRPRDVTYVVVDELQAAPFLQNALEGSAVSLQVHSGENAAAQAVLNGQAEGYFVLNDEFVQTGTLTIYMEKQRQRPDALTNALSGLLQTMRLQEQQLDESVLAYVSAQPRFVTSILNAEEDDIPLMGFPMSIAFGFLLFYLTMISGSMLLQSAVQEKRDRMSEVVLSSIGADTLMTGKIVGHFVLGALQIIFWLAIGLPIAHFVMELPLGDFIVPQLLPQLFLFTMLGYLFYAALFVGIGATMEDIQSASNSQGMVFMLPMLSFFVVGPIFNNPEGTIAKIATFFPVTSPTITILRIGAEAIETWEVVAAAAIMLVSTWLVIKAASRLFRAGMLMYGKNATWQEMWKWLRHPS